MFKYIFSVFSILFISLVVQASHVPGGNITYECVAPNQYLVTLTLYEDCSTWFIGQGSSFSINVDNSCGLPTQNVQATEVMYQNDVSQLCPTAQSTCNGGAYPGVFMHQYQVLVTLPAGCDSWTFSHSSCCRNGSINAPNIGDSYYFYASVDNLNAACNNSPTYTSAPIPYVCSGQSVCFSLGAVEIDGDSLVYSLVDALQNSTLSVGYAAGYSGATPIPGISIDPITGQVIFTAPPTTGQYVVAILLEEYDANGNVIGSQVYDYVFNVINCNNQVIDCATSGVVGNIVGSVFQTGPTSIQMCEGVPFSFDMTFVDPDIGDSLYINSNVNIILPGSIVTYAYNNSPNANEITMSVTWVPPPGSANSNNTFSVTIYDNACPVLGQQTIVYNMDVVGSTNASPDMILCLGQDAQLEVFNGSIFDWSVISGDPINIGVNFSCTPCSNPIASPTVTTVYEVVSDLTGNCVNRDTVQITVVPDFTYSLTQSATTTCLNSEILLDVTPSPSGAYTYDWSPSTFLNNAAISNPIVSPATPGNIDYEITVTSPDGCVKTDTISINVAAAYAPDITLTASDSSVVCGDSVYLNIELGGGIPAVCGLSAVTTCSSPASQQTLGVNQGVNTSTSWPAPFGNWYRNAKHQFLYTAAELQAAGFVGGKITEIAWETTVSNGATSTFMGYTIRMSCTNLTALSSWQNTDANTSFVTVFSPQNINVVLGWNTLVLTSAYEWDGISNLVVEICYDNLSVPYTYNWATPIYQTAFNSVLEYHSDFDPMCPFLLLETIGNRRPVTRFTSCPTIPDPTNFTYQWTPGTFLSSTTVQNPSSFPQITTTYNVVVTDINGGCTDTAEVTIDVMCDTCMAPIPAITGVTCYGGNDGAILAQPAGIDGPPWIVELLDASSGSQLQVDNNVVTNTTFSNLAAGDYILRSTDTTGCYADTLVTVNEPPELFVIVSNDTIICIGGNAVISATGVGGTLPYTFDWAGLAGSGPHIVTPTLSNYFVVSAIDANGCTSSVDSVLVAINPPIILTPSSNDTVCPGGTATLSILANGGGGTYNYVWTDMSGTQVGNTSVADVIPPNSPYTYYVMVTDNCQTPPAYDSLMVLWYQEPQVDFISNNFTGCYPISPGFTNTTPSNQILNCEWNFGDGNTSSVCGTVSNVYNVPGNYSVTLTVTSPEGCINDTTMIDLIEVYDYPDAEFLATPNPTDILHPTIEFLDQSSADVINYYWTFMDLQGNVLGTSGTQNPIYTFPDNEPDLYDVLLLVTNANGCTDTTSVQVIINGVFTCYVPSAFTPDGDGLNDFFFVRGESIDSETFNFSIYNKWGDRIFEGEDINEKWDGTYKNLPVQEDMYIWKLDTKDAVTGEHKEFTGHVILLR